MGRTPIWLDLMLLEAFSNLFHDFGARVEPHLCPARGHSFGTAHGTTPNAANVPTCRVSPHRAALAPCCWHVPRWLRSLGVTGIQQQKATLGSYPDGAKSCQAQRQCHHPAGVTSPSARQERGWSAATQGISPVHTMGYKNQPWESGNPGNSSFPKLPYREFGSTSTDPDGPPHATRFSGRLIRGGMG